MTNHEIFDCIGHQLNWCEKNKIFPENIREQSSIFAEEALEVIQAVNDFSEPEKTGSKQKIASELIDLVAVCFRILKGL